MRFDYRYRTSDNAIRSGTVKAPNREAAFAILKKDGIRPSALAPSPGVLNWLCGRWHRLSLAIAISIVLLALGYWGYRQRQIVDASNESLYGPMPRHQIFGEPAIISVWNRGDFSSLFPNEGDRLLACYARPGLEIPRPRDAANAIRNVGASRIEFIAGESREDREMKQIVLGMRAELLRYLKEGSGTVDTYVVRLEERQRRERALYLNAEAKLRDCIDPDEWRKTNASLRAMGLSTIPVPDEVSSAQK